MHPPRTSPAPVSILAILVSRHLKGSLIVTRCVNSKNDDYASPVPVSADASPSDADKAALCSPEQGLFSEDQASKLHIGRYWTDVLLKAAGQTLDGGNGTDTRKGTIRHRYGTLASSLWEGLLST